MPDQHLRRFAGFATFAAIWTYGLIVFGGIVRITGSGMGCGEHWPKCNGHWIPPFTLETLIEYAHRLLGVSIGLVLIAVFVYALLHRREPGFAGKGGLLQYSLAVLLLVVVQGLLGAVTVWLNLPAKVIVVHFSTALIIMAVLIAAAVRARELIRSRSTASARGGNQGATVAAGLVFVTVVFGAIVANNQGAPQACQGFPLCNGSLLPSAQNLVLMHWSHRLVAFATFFYVLYQAFRTWTQSAVASVRNSAIAAAVAISLQVGVAAALVLMNLPPSMRTLHLAVGAAVWAAVVTWAALARSYA
jgi:heme A synthase